MENFKTMQWVTMKEEIKEMFSKLSDRRIAKNYLFLSINPNKDNYCLVIDPDNQQVLEFPVSYFE